MAKLIVLRGNSGSGKTTLAKLLQDRCGPNTMRLSHDMVRMEILHVWGKEGIERSLPLMMTLLRYGREHSPVTILEGILVAEEYAPLFREAQALYGGENIFAYYYDLPFGETLRRHATKPNREDFGEAEMRRWWREKDYLGFLPETRLSWEISLEEAAERICREAGLAAWEE